jgi:hypothetical protein
MPKYFEDVEVDDQVFDLAKGEGIVTAVYEEDPSTLEPGHFTVVFNLDPTTEYNYHLSGVRYGNLYQTLYYLDDRPTVVRPTPVKVYELEGGDWRITSRGTVENIPSDENASDFGMERKTEELALNSSYIMRNFHRLQALRDELCPDSAGYFFRRNLPNYHIQFRFLTNQYEPFMDRYYFNPFSVYFKTKEDCEMIVNMLNAGEFIIEKKYSDDYDPAYFVTDPDLPLEEDSGSGSSGEESSDGSDSGSAVDPGSESGGAGSGSGS